MAAPSMCEENLVTDGVVCETRPKVIKATYTWIVHDFSLRREETGQAMESSAFSASDHDGIQWCLVLYPNGESERCKDYVSVFLRRMFSNCSSFLAQYEIAVLGEEGQKVCAVRAPPSRFAFGSACGGFHSFIKRDRLLKGTEHLLPNDRLTIRCEVLAFVDSVKILPAVNVPDCRLSQDLGRLLESRRCCDVIIRAAGREIHAHKGILAARSSVFAAMFEHEMTERKEGRVEVTDCDFEVLREVVEYIYTGRARKLHKMAEKVLVAADKYDLSRLKAMCESVLCAKLSVKTAPEMLALADMHNAGQLRAKAVRCIKENATRVLESDDWMAMARTKPHLVAEVMRALEAEKNGSK
ncbi:hypothetical protein HPB48_021034 [Haemaphysalis longicornis]|uniref:Speckle-type POZ protein n=1 Tax=Haemaphysalis longicornis TaxID=44386 RepID=A0A9J6G8V0_HAELO|nr:hypothetical protein HPB48_021034 [Haemaphysalis longicornis]